MKKWESKLWSINEKRSEVKKVGKFVKLEKIKEWKNVMGVYIFADKKKNIKYVGYAGSSNLQKEAKSACYQRKKAKGATLACYIQCTNKKYAKKLENELKHYYTPVNNKDI